MLQALAGVVVGFVLAEGARLLRYRWRLRELREALRAECRSLIAQIPQLIDITRE